MQGNRKVGRGFRRLLRRELDLWRDEGLVSAEQFDALKSRYALGDIEKERTSNLIAVVYAIGAVLIGGGVISFVAAHWEGIPKAVKVTLILAAMLAAHAGGYWLWRVRGTRPALGHALVALGTLIFGANIGLVAQIFHIKGDFYNGFAAWAAGALVMAYALSSVPNAVIAVVTSFIWFWGQVDHSPVLSAVYALGVLALGLPLAYWRRSGVLFFFVLLAFGVSVFASASSHDDLAEIYATACLVLFLGAYGAFHRTVKPRAEAASTALVFGGIALGLWSYVFSFDYYHYRSLDDVMWPSGQGIAVLALVIIITVAGLVLAVLSFARMLHMRALRAYVLSLWAGALLMFMASVATVFSDAWIVTPVVFANCALLALAAGCIWSGVLSLSRAPFWLGVALVGLEIITRFLEYQTDLTTKAGVFLVLGVAVIVGGVRFENALRSRGIVNE